MKSSAPPEGERALSGGQSSMYEVRKMKKRFWWALSVVILLCLFVVLGAGAEEKSIVAQGTCGAQGDNLTWTLDREGTLTISGEGEMEYSPWEQPESIKSAIKSIIIEDGVTNVADYAFCGCGSLTSVTLPKGLLSINEWAFAECSSLKSIVLPEGLTSVGVDAFEGCESLANVTFPESLTRIDYAAFTGCDALMSVTLPTGVTNIGDYAFQNTRCYVMHGTDTAKALSKAKCRFWEGDLAYQYVYDEDSITGLKVVGCDPHVTSVVISDDVTSIGNDAFYNCSSLTSVTLPDSVTSIDYNAFVGCSSLESVTLPDHIKSIGSYICEDSTRCYANFETETAEALAKSQCRFWNGNLAYQYKKDENDITGLSVVDCDPQATSVVISDDVTSIGGNAFRDCSLLISVTLPDSLTSIGDGAFVNCSSLESVTLPDHIKSIGSYICEDSTKCYANFGTETAEALAKAQCRFWNGDLAYRYKNDEDDITGLCVEGCNPQVTSVVVPDGVTNISYSAFRDCSSLTSVTFPDGLICIEGWAFYNCSSLTSVTLPNSLTSVDGWAFMNCSSLASVILPDHIKKVGSNICADSTKCYANLGTETAEALAKAQCRFWNGDLAYRYKNGEDDIVGLSVVDCDPQVTSVVVPDGVTSISNSVFCDCSFLTSVTLPESLASIGDGAFRRCSALSSITLSKGLKNIDGRAFEECNSLTSVTMPDGLISIGDWAFAECNSLMDVTLPESLMSIGDGVFQGCSALTSVALPDGVTSIGQSTFSGCSSLTNIDLPDKITSIGDYAFGYCVALLHVDLPNNLTRIGNFAFEGCSSLISIDLPDGVTVIGDVAFGAFGSLTHVGLPRTLTSIGNSAFRSCFQLMDVTLPEGLISIGDSVFTETRICKLVLPSTIQVIGESVVADSEGGVSIICKAKDGPTQFPENLITNIDDVIYCWKSSPMEAYANEKGYPVILLDDLLDEQGNIDWNRDLMEKRLVVQETCDLRVGESRKLSWDFAPGTPAAVEMTSSAPDIVSVQDGVATSLKPGFATITITADGLTASCKVTSYELYTRLSFAEKEIYLPAKYTPSFEMTCEPEDSNEPLLWNIGGNDGGDDYYGEWDNVGGDYITGKLGRVKVSVKSKYSSLKDTCTVIVTYPVTSITFGDDSSVSGIVGEQRQLTANVLARTRRYQNKLVLFTSSNPDVAQVDRHGLVTLLAPGSAIITATAMGNEKITATCELTVRGREDVQLKLPANLLVVEEEAFANIGTAAVILPEGCQRIESRAFADSSVTSIKIPASVTSIADDAFAGCAVTISAPEDSFAMNWAKEHGVPYIVE